MPFWVLICYWALDAAEDSRPYIRVHEFVHVAQDERNFCFLVTWAKYLWEFVRHGYKKNRYETEAYATLGKPLPGWAA